MFTYSFLKSVKLSDSSKSMTPKPMSLDPSDEELGLTNPYSFITCFILYLYSLEFGDPPLYAEMNRVVWTMDKDYL